MSTETQQTVTAMVRAAGSDLDDMGPPGPGRYYLVLELPTGHNDMVHEAMMRSRIQLSAAEGPTPSRKLSREKLVALREHMATQPQAPEPDPDPEVNVARFDEGCKFDDWAEEQLDGLPCPIILAPEGSS